MPGLLLPLGGDECWRGPFWSAAPLPSPPVLLLTWDAFGLGLGPLCPLCAAALLKLPGVFLPSDGGDLWVGPFCTFCTAALPELSGLLLASGGGALRWQALCGLLSFGLLSFAPLSWLLAARCACCVTRSDRILLISCC